MLAVEGVSKRYGSVTALSGVSFTVRPGEIVALVGENGAGKSSLVRCIARSTVADEGRITIAGEEIGRTPAEAIAQGLAVVWQDLSLCDNLDVTANLFLGRELAVRRGLRRAAMHAAAARILADLGVTVGAVDQPVDRLSAGQRQLVAIARATLELPRVLVLDEPTAALGVSESHHVLAVLERLQARGVAIVLVSHQLEDVFDVADRIAVLRHGRLVADLHRTETHPDDVVALITGVDVETTAGQQLRRLHSLSEQLADAEQGSVLPLTVSSLSAALSVDRLAIFLAEESGDGPSFRLSAGLHLPADLEAGLAAIPAGPAGGFLGTAAATATIQVVSETAERHDDSVAVAAAAAGLRGAWAAPIVGQGSTLAVIAGFTDGSAQLQPDQVQLLELFSTMAGAAIERGRLVESLRTRNRSLSGLQAVLEALAGPDVLAQGLGAALDALCRGIGGSYASLLVETEPGVLIERASSSRLDEAEVRKAKVVVAAVISGQLRRPDVSVTRFEWSRGIGVLSCLWAEALPTPEAEQVLEGAANSLRLALERELAAEAEREAVALQRSRAIERTLTRRLGHELRTPLTAIRGFASTMLQTDVEWSAGDKQRFLEIIESEAGRMGRLVAQLFDDSALGSGTLRLDFNYCDLVAVIDRAVSIVDASRPISTAMPSDLTVWGDRDRLEQLVVNLVDNAVRHNGDDTAVEVRVRPTGDPGRVVVSVIDEGIGLPEDVVDYLNGAADELKPGRGMGIRLARGFARAHGGSIAARSSSKGSVIDVELPTEGGDPPSESEPQ